MFKGEITMPKKEEDLLKINAQKRLEKVRYDYKKPKRKKKQIKDYVTILMIIVVLAGLIISLLQLFQLH